MKCIAAISLSIFLASAPVVASSSEYIPYITYTIDALELEVTLPSRMLVLSQTEVYPHQDISVTDADVVEAQQEMRENDVFLKAISANLEYEILVWSYSDEWSEYHWEFSEETLTKDNVDEQTLREDLLSELENSALYGVDGLTVLSTDVYTSNSWVYSCFEIEKAGVHAYIFGTVNNGQYVYFQLNSYSGPVSSARYAILKKVVDTAVYTRHPAPAPADTGVTGSQPLATGLAWALLVVFVYFVIRTLVRRKKKHHSTPKPAPIRPDDAIKLIANSMDELLSLSNHARQAGRIPIIRNNDDALVLLALFCHVTIQLTTVNQAELLTAADRYLLSKNTGALGLNRFHDVFQLVEGVWNNLKAKAPTVFDEIRVTSLYSGFAYETMGRDNTDDSHQDFEEYLALFILSLKKN